MNALLQCLAHTTEFSGWLMNDSFMPQLQKNILAKMAKDTREKKKLGESDPIEIKKSDFIKEVESTFTYRLTQVIKSLWECNWTVVPDDFKESIRDIDEQYSYKQNDSQELLIQLMDILHKEMAKPVLSVSFRDVPPDAHKMIKYHHDMCKAHKDATTPEEKAEISAKYRTYVRNNQRAYVIVKSYMHWKKYMKTEHKSIIIELFTGIYHSKIECSQCKNLTSQFESFTMMSIPIKETGNDTLTNCLKKFSETEVLDGDEAYHCEECNDKVKATKSIEVWEPPEVLIIHLKRFENYVTPQGRVGLKKKHGLIDFPLEGLELTECLSDVYPRKKMTYNLYATCEHSGGYSGGHYISRCRNALNNLWYEFNDTTVRHIPDKDIKEKLVTQNAYLLFYIKNLPEKTPENLKE
jgi:ubiquitin C-terminal hydrolase